MSAAAARLRILQGHLQATESSGLEQAELAASSCAACVQELTGQLLKGQVAIITGQLQALSLCPPIEPI